MPRFWMISNRNLTKDGLGTSLGRLSYWTTDSSTVDDFGAWQRQSATTFRRLLAGEADRFPALAAHQHEDQKHVTLFVHGYNTTWDEAARVYRRIADGLFTGSQSLGTCVLFTWPSKGSPADYLPDRSEAEASAPALAELLEDLYDWLADRQQDAARDPSAACKAKTSLIAHSMGNYVLQKAMQTVWTRKNQPLLVSLLNQLLMVAADVDNDLFKSGETVDRSDGDAIANLTYRVTVLFSGLDEILGLSAGLKHFGKRRLGRSGLDSSVPVPDNVWQHDCSPLFEGQQRGVHGAYFKHQPVFDFMRQVLRGVDRTVIQARMAGANSPK
jgi:esterase/lipase superfamily enzyme